MGSLDSSIHVQMPFIHTTHDKSRSKVAFTFEFWTSPSRPRGDDEWLRWGYYVSQSQWTVLMMFLKFENKHRLSAAKENLTRGAY